MSNIVPAAPRSVLVDMAGRYGMEPAAFEATVRSTCMSGQTVSREQFAAFLLVAKEYGLNPLIKEIYAFPAKGGGIQPIVSIDGWMSMINAHPECDGLEFDDHLDGDGKLAAVTCRIYRKDRSRPTSVTEYMAECRRNTDVWRQWPARMLRHKTAIQCARYAFGFSGIMEPDEADRMRDVTPAADTGLRARLQARQEPAAEGFTAAHRTAPTVSETVADVGPATGEIMDEQAAPDPEQETGGTTEAGVDAPAAAPRLPRETFDAYGGVLVRYGEQEKLKAAAVAFWPEHGGWPPAHPADLDLAKRIMETHKNRAAGKVAIEDAKAHVADLVADSYGEAL